MSAQPTHRTDVFAAIGDARRRTILELLSAGERSVGSLAVELGIAQPSVTQHLAVLRAVNLVEVEKRGTSSIYRLVPRPLTEVTDWIDRLRP